MSFYCAQVFFLDSALVARAPEIAISRVDLFCRLKPNRAANKSGIVAPGITIALVPTLLPGTGGASIPTPDMSQYDAAPKTRLDWDQILASTDATISTTFRYANLAHLATDKYYGLVIKCDGDEDYVLWDCVQGDNLIGTQTPCPGPSGKYVGAYFSSVSKIPVQPGAVGGNSGVIQTSTLSTSPASTANGVLADTWRAITGKDLKFKVFCARFAVNGNTNISNVASSNSLIPQPVTNGGANTTSGGPGEVQLSMQSGRYEYATFDRKNSRWGNTLHGEKIFQHTRYHPGGRATPFRISVRANSALVSHSEGANLDFTALYGQSSDQEFMVITSLNHAGANQDKVAVRRISRVVNSSTLQLVSNCFFTNTVAYFYKTAVAEIERISTGRLFGYDDDVVFMCNSHANSSVRFANHSVSSLTITGNGTGYSNSDYVSLTGFEHLAGVVQGGYAATANIVTNANGSLTAIYLSNIGAGFVNTGNIAVAVTNSTGHNSTGSGITLTVNVGSTLRTEFLGGTGNSGFFSNCKIVNIELGEVAPSIILNNPATTAFSMHHTLPHYSEPDSNTFSGTRYFRDPPASQENYEVKPFYRHSSINFTKRRCAVSWSNEFNTLHSNGTTPTVNTIGEGTNSSVITINAISNSDFTCVAADPGTSTVTFSKYVINNDYTNEHTNYGNAMAKGVEQKVTFANGNYAEDVRVFATAYRPANTNIKMYLRVWNDHDPEAFDDKDWTLLEAGIGGNVYSSSTDTSDFIEIEYGFSKYPNNTPFTGTATTVLANTIVNGVGTDWSTNTTVNVVAGSLVLLYQPLFPNNYMVAVVNSVANNTRLTLQVPVTNNGLVGAGLKVARIDYPHQVFVNGLNDNVVRYYDSSMVEHDSYSTFQLKTVLLSADGKTIPMVDDVRIVGISS